MLYQTKRYKTNFNWWKCLGRCKTGKASLGDGINSTTNNVDKNLENIKVSLYTEDMKLAELMPADSVTNIYNRINPTLTDANGNYKFEGVDESKNIMLYLNMMVKYICQQNTWQKEFPEIQFKTIIQ